MISFLKLVCWLAADESGRIWYHTEKPELKHGDYVSAGDFCIAFNEDLPEEYRNLTVEDGPKRVEVVASEFKIKKV